MVTDRKKSSPNKNYKNIAINWWNNLHGKNKFLFLIIIFMGILAITGMSGLLGTDKPTQKMTTINEMSTALEYTQPIITDFYTSLKKYDSGAIDSVTVTNKLQADKLIVDYRISKLKSVKPPDELQHPYNLVLSSLEDLSMSIGLGIDGIKNDNFPEIYRAMSLKNYLTLKFDEANNEVSDLQYSANEI